MEIQEILDKLPKINENRSYWLFRTDGGKHYESFYKGNFIAIGYNKITLQDVKSGNTKNEVGVEILAEKIKKSYKDDEKRPKHTARQLLKFSYEIKKGDIVMIPSENSEYISFGEVLDSAAFNDFEGKFECDYIKRKRVKWLKTLNRDNLDPNLYKLMFSHHTISFADHYAEYIDKILSSFFIKDNKAHVVLQVNSSDDIKARSLFALGDLTLDLLDEFSKEESLEMDSDNLEVKLSVQSPGFILLAGTNLSAIIITGIIVVLIVGGGMSLKVGDDVNFSMTSDGLVERIRKFLSTNTKAKRKKELLNEYMKDLKVEDPEDLVKILNELNKE